MQVQAKVVSVEMDVSIKKKDGGTYQGARLSYRDADGTMKEQAFHSNALKFNPAIKEALSGLASGDDIIMTKEKEGEFWNVKNISKGVITGEAAGVSKAYASPKSTYETPEERAKKQVYIVRQSAINQAINYKAGKATVQEILDTASIFEAYVFSDNSVADVEII